MMDTMTHPRPRGKMSPPILLLDVMSTLVHDPFGHELPDFFDCDMRALIPQLSHQAWVDFESARIDEATFFDRMFHDGRRVDGEGLRGLLRASYRWLEGIEPLLASLRAQGVEMHALSNYPVWYELIEDELGLSRYLSWRFVSWRTGVRKPDPRAYLEAARALGVEPERCLFVDDRRDNCEASEAVGVPAIRFESARSLAEALRRRGVPGA